MIEEGLDNMNRDAEPRATARESPAQIVKLPMRRSGWHARVESVFDETKRSDSLLPFNVKIRSEPSIRGKPFKTSTAKSTVGLCAPGILGALFWERPNLRIKVDFAPPHLGNFVPPRTSQDQKLDEFAIGLFQPIRCPPERREFVIAQYPIPRGFNRRRPDSDTRIGVQNAAFDHPVEKRVQPRQSPVRGDRRRAFDDCIQKRVDILFADMGKRPFSPRGCDFLGEQALDFMRGSRLQFALAMRSNELLDNGCDGIVGRNGLRDPFGFFLGGRIDVAGNFHGRGGGLRAGGRKAGRRIGPIVNFRGLPPNL